MFFATLERIRPLAGEVFGADGERIALVPAASYTAWPSLPGTFPWRRGGVCWCWKTTLADLVRIGAHCRERGMALVVEAAAGMGFHAPVPTARGPHMTGLRSSRGWPRPWRHTTCT
ncbi:MAG: hypothetical protein LDL27_07420 [Desulfovibrio sp.]|nr:hypothetical protein [Desulfovibrio sp.]